jgi:hypothetical protein
METDVDFFNRIGRLSPVAKDGHRLNPQLKAAFHEKAAIDEKQVV